MVVSTVQGASVPPDARTALPDIPAPPTTMYVAPPVFDVVAKIAWPAPSITAVEFNVVPVVVSFGTGKPRVPLTTPPDCPNTPSEIKHISVTRNIFLIDNSSDQFPRNWLGIRYGQAFTPL